VDVDEVARQLAQVMGAEAELRTMLDEILAARRALDRGMLGRLDALLHGRADRALAVLDELVATDLQLLLAAMPRVQSLAAA
jgi:hypothetical protein